MEFDVLIEIPRGSRNKYEVDHESGLIRLRSEERRVGKECLE